MSTPDSEILTCAARPPMPRDAPRQSAVPRRLDQFLDPVIEELDHCGDVVRDPGEQRMMVTEAAGAHHGQIRDLYRPLREPARPALGNGTIADVVVVWARDVAEGQATVFLVEKSTPGYDARRIDGRARCGQCGKPRSR
jgi:hypothetical protein